MSESLVHLQLEEILHKLLKDHSEAGDEFSVMVHQILGHMTVADGALRKFYAKDGLFLSLVPLLASENVAIVLSALSILVALLMSVPRLCNVKDSESDQDVEAIKTGLKELPLEKDLKEVEEKAGDESKCTVDQREDILKSCQQIAKLLN